MPRKRFKPPRYGRKVCTHQKCDGDSTSGALQKIEKPEKRTSRRCNRPDIKCGDGSQRTENKPLIKELVDGVVDPDNGRNGRTTPGGGGLRKESQTREDPHDEMGLPGWIEPLAFPGGGDRRYDGGRLLRSQHLDASGNSKAAKRQNGPIPHIRQQGPRRKRNDQGLQDRWVKLLWHKPFVIELLDALRESIGRGFGAIRPRVPIDIPILLNFYPIYLSGNGIKDKDLEKRVWRAQTRGTSGVGARYNWHIPPTTDIMSIGDLNVNGIPALVIAVDSRARKVHANVPLA
ncbi:hypothetical protein B0H13DRAFT_1910800 [Mycena leptocephala]|nr:hypothetical protein B0H13DRAFT_1910800 [Mycena leptocephala]